MITLAPITITNGQTLNIAVGTKQTTSGVILVNESDNALLVQIGSVRQAALWLPAWTADMVPVNQFLSFDGSITVTSQWIGSGIPIVGPSSVLLITLIAPGEVSPGIYPYSLVRQTNGSTASTLVNTTNIRFTTGIINVHPTSDVNAGMQADNSGNFTVQGLDLAVDEIFFQTNSFLTLAGSLIIGMAKNDPSIQNTANGSWEFTGSNVQVDGTVKTNSIQPRTGNFIFVNPAGTGTLSVDKMQGNLNSGTDITASILRLVVGTITRISAGMSGTGPTTVTHGLGVQPDFIFITPSGTTNTQTCGVQFANPTVTTFEVHTAVGQQWIAVAVKF